MIECHGLTKHYGNARGVRDLTFRVSPGTVVGLLGPNGAGKTTTIRLLTGSMPPSSGQALVSGIVVQDDPMAVRRLLGYLPENSPAWPTMTCAAVVDYLLALRRPDWGRGQRREAVKAALSAVKLWDRANRRVATLSKGMRQRLGLAQAMAGDTSLMILDEPTAGLDPEQVADVRALLARLADEGRTIVLASHHLSEVESIARQVLILDEGRLVVQGSPLELCRALEPRYRLVLRETPKGAEATLTAECAGWSFTRDGGEIVAAPKGASCDAAEIPAVCHRHGWGVESWSAERRTLEEVYVGALRESRGKKLQTSESQIQDG